MDQPIKKPKYDRATSEQLQFYVKFCRQQPQILNGKNKHLPENQQLWIDLAYGLNALRGPTRTAAKWKETLGVWRSQLRIRGRRLKTNQGINYSGPYVKPLSEFEKFALSTFRLPPNEGKKSAGTVYLLPPQQSVPLIKDELDIPCGSPSSLENSLPSPEQPLQDGDASSQSPSLSQSLVADICHDFPPVNQIDSEEPHRVHSNHLECGNMFQTLLNSIKEREEREKQQFLLLEQQQRETVQALQCLVSCVTSLVDEIKKITNKF